MNKAPELNLSRYYVNKNAMGNGIHKLHKNECNLLQNTETCIDLGIHMNHKSAILKAMDYYQHTNYCFCCNKDCKPN